MGYVNLPTPVFVAGGALCVLGGYLLGVVAGPDTPDRTTGIVESYEPSSSTLCLSGEQVGRHPEADPEGQLCGSWRRSTGAEDPREGEAFRYVAVRTGDPPDDADTARVGQVLIYGDVVD